MAQLFNLNPAVVLEALCAFTTVAMFLICMAGTVNNIRKSAK